MGDHLDLGIVNYGILDLPFGFKILANLPERCDETCQTRVTEALTKIAERIEARVAAANCEPRPSRP